MNDTQNEASTITMEAKLPNNIETQAHGQVEMHSKENHESRFDIQAKAKTLHHDAQNVLCEKAKRSWQH